MRDRHQAVDECWRERLHAFDGNPLRDLRKHLRQARKLVLHLPRTLPQLRAQQHLPAGWQLCIAEFFRKTSLVGDREETQRFELVTEKLDPHRMLGDGREHVKNSAANRELAPPGDHVDAGVREVDQLGRERGQVVAAAASCEHQRCKLGEVVGEWLERGTNAGHDDDRMLRRDCFALGPVLQAAEGVDALADRFVARAQPLVRKRLPGGELDDLGGRGNAGQGIPKRLRFAACRDNNKESFRPGALSQQTGQKRCPQPVNQREIGVAAGV